MHLQVLSESVLSVIDLCRVYRQWTIYRFVWHRVGMLSYYLTEGRYFSLLDDSTYVVHLPRVFVRLIFFGLCFLMYDILLEMYFKISSVLLRRFVSV